MEDALLLQSELVILGVLAGDNFVMELCRGYRISESSAHADEHLVKTDADQVNMLRAVNRLPKLDFANESVRLI